MIDIWNEYSDLLLHGALVTVELTVIAIVTSFILGIVIGILRCFGGRFLSAALGVPVDILRCIPLLVILVWIFFAGPGLLGLSSMSPFVAAVIGLSLVQTAFVSEIVRGGLVSVRSGQERAGLALGMSRVQVIHRVILPQALIRMIPPLGSQALLTLRDSTLASVVAAPELLRESQVIIGQTFQPLEMFTFLVVVYFAAGLLMARVIDWFYSRLAPRGAS